MPLPINHPIPTPQDMDMLPAALRAGWRMNLLIAKIVHQLFLTFDSGDFISMEGGTEDFAMFQGAAAVLTQAGWQVLVTHEATRVIIRVGRHKAGMIELAKIDTTGMIVENINARPTGVPD